MKIVLPSNLLRNYLLLLMLSIRDVFFFFFFFFVFFLMKQYEKMYVVKTCLLLKTNSNKNGCLSKMIKGIVKKNIKNFNFFFEKSGKIL